MPPARSSTRDTNSRLPSSRKHNDHCVPRPYNVIVFGEAGVGKSSLINLITGLRQAKTSPDADACTERNQDYDVTIGDQKFKIWDTVGLDGGTFGRIHATLAERNLKKFLSKFLKKGELDLLVYCVRASRATQALVRHYKTFYSSVCKSSIPVVVIVTCLENVPGEMDSWWKKNAPSLGRLGMVFTGHACVTTIPDDPSDAATLRARREYSRQAVHDLMIDNCRPHELQSDENPAIRVVRDSGRSWNPVSFLLSMIPWRL